MVQAIKLMDMSQNGEAAFWIKRIVPMHHLG